VLNAILCFISFGIFAYGVTDALLQKKYEPGIVMPLFYAAALAISLMFFKKFRSNRVFLRINHAGIYKDEKLVTDWDHLIRAHITQREGRLLNLTDAFILVIEYTKTDPEKGYRTIVPLTNTQNRSEEDIMAALKHFSQ
jgi:hypothetical protein